MRNKKGMGKRDHLEGLRKGEMYVWMHGKVLGILSRMTCGLKPGYGTVYRFITASDKFLFVSKLYPKGIFYINSQQT